MAFDGIVTKSIVSSLKTGTSFTNMSGTTPNVPTAVVAAPDSVPLNEIL